jgi:hypothetical protein
MEIFCGNMINGYPECRLHKPPGGSLPKCAGIGAGIAGGCMYIWPKWQNISKNVNKWQNRAKMAKNGQ